MATVVAAIALAAAGTVGAASAASTVTVTSSSHAPSDMSIHLADQLVQPFGSAHTCTKGVLSDGTTNDGTNQGVFCADVKNSTNGATVQVDMGPEGVCQNVHTSGFTQCADMEFFFALWTQGRALSPTFHWGCGHAPNALCPPGRVIVDVTISVPLSGCEEAWTVVDAGSTIELPRTARTATLTANLGSGHITICP